MNLPNYPTQEVKAFGEAVASALINARVQVSMDGLGGCKYYDISDFDAELRPYIEAYLEGNHDSVAIMYAAMRTKELEVA
jgi:hypothetical protein